MERKHKAFIYASEQIEMEREKREEQKMKNQPRPPKRRR
jgi:hypothetical protein